MGGHSDPPRGAVAAFRWYFQESASHVSCDHEVRGTTSHRGLHPCDSHLPLCCDYVEWCSWRRRSSCWCIFHSCPWLFGALHVNHWWWEVQHLPLRTHVVYGIIFAWRSSTSSRESL